MTNLVTEFYVPSQMKINTKKFYIFISTLYYDLKQLNNREIKINFSKLRWIDPAICAPLAMLFNYFIENNKLTFKFVRISERFLNIFNNNNFIKILNKKNKENYKNPSIKLANISTDNSHYLESYLNENLKTHNFYIENNSLWRELIRCFLEIFNNSLKHGKAERIFVCGHFFPETQTLIFSFANLGETFRTNYLKNLNYNFDNDLLSIIYSLDLYSTSRKNDETGGFGLYYIKNFLKDHNGEIIIYSGNGLHIETFEETNCHTLDKVFPGTIVSIKIHLTKPFFEEEENTIIYNLDLNNFI